MKADLHIHTVLSPCGDIEMTPLAVVRQARELGIGIIAVTDHNTTRHGPETRRIGEREGICVLYGAEICTREEVHALALVEGERERVELQSFLDRSLPKIPNKPEVFGYQLQVNEQEEVLYEEPYLLISAIDKSIEEVSEFVRSLGGIFIPAHIDKQRDSILSQLGFVPPHLDVDALELSHRGDPGKLLQEQPYLSKYPLVRSSDSHYREEMGRAWTELETETTSFEAIRKAIRQSMLR